MSIDGVNTEAMKTNLNAMAQKNAEAAVKRFNSASDDNQTEIVDIVGGVVDTLIDGVEAVVEEATKETPDTKLVKGDPRVEASEFEVVNSAMAWGIRTADDDSHGYSQGDRWGPNYDCSSLVISAYAAAGIPLQEYGANNTYTLKNACLESGKFEWIEGPIDTSSLQPGDLILDESSHVEMYVGNGNTLGAHDNYDGGDGDSTGTEIDIAPLSMGWWYPSGVLRYTG